MANKQIIDYIREAQKSQLTKAEILHNLKEAGWSDPEVRDGFAYVNLYGAKPEASRIFPMPVQTAGHLSWISMSAACVGYVWLVSGINKIASDRFVSGFADFIRGQISDGQAPAFYKSFLASVILPQASLMSRVIEYSEFGIGLVLVIGGIWHFFSAGKFLNFILCLASIGSALMILNIILSLGMPLPWVDIENVFAQGVNIEYLIFFVSLVLTGAYFNDL